MVSPPGGLGILTLTGVKQKGKPCASLIVPSTSGRRCTPISVIRLELDLGANTGHRRGWARVHQRSAGSIAGAGRTAAPAANRRQRAPPARDQGAWLGHVFGMSRSDCTTSPARRHLRQDRSVDSGQRLHRGLNTQREKSPPAAGTETAGLMLPPDHSLRCRRISTGPLNATTSSATPAPRTRAVNRLAGAGRAGSRDSMAASEPVFAGAAGLTNTSSASGRSPADPHIAVGWPATERPTASCHPRPAGAAPGTGDQRGWRDRAARQLGGPVVTAVQQPRAQHHHHRGTRSGARGYRAHASIRAR